jgi:RNA polymerase sigma factor (sigma-70 family)
MKNIPTQNKERQLLNDCLQKDNCNPLIKQYIKLIEYTIRKIGERKNHFFSSEDIKDLRQDTFVELFKNGCYRLRSYDENKCESKLAGFIQMIAIHTVWNHLEKIRDPFTYSSRHKLSLLDDDIIQLLNPVEIEDQLDARQQILLILECLNKDDISDIGRMIFKLFYFDAESLEDIAQLTGRNVGAIRTAKSRTVSSVKDCVEEK